jgi:hypothetical protein
MIACVTSCEVQPPRDAMMRRLRSAKAFALPAALSIVAAIGVARAVEASVPPSEFDRKTGQPIRSERGATRGSIVAFALPESSR